METEKKPSGPGDKAQQAADETTKNKIARHLTDVNDTISENDIKNIKTDISSGGTGETNAAGEKENDAGQKPADRQGVPGDAPNPWDVLD